MIVTVHVPAPTGVTVNVALGPLERLGETVAIVPALGLHESFSAKLPVYPLSLAMNDCVLFVAVNERVLTVVESGTRGVDVGAGVGGAVGAVVGAGDGVGVGASVGAGDGVGVAVGAVVGVGAGLGVAVGAVVGAGVGIGVGVGAGLGVGVGASVGVAVGAVVGVGPIGTGTVGNSVPPPPPPPPHPARMAHPATMAHAADPRNLRAFIDTIHNHREHRET